MQAEETLESTIGCKYPIVASGATPIGSADRAPDRKTNRREVYFLQVNKYECTRKKLSLYLNYKNSTIASGATPIGSTGCAPDDYKLSAT
jgi:hypothetical protein